MKVIFLDRDGVINKDAGIGDYVKGWHEFEFLPGALKALKKLNKAGYTVFVVSNQAGVAKGLYTKKALNKLTVNMCKEISRVGGKIQAVCYCIHKDEDNCACRKPKPGLLLQAVEGREVDFSEVYFIGDSRRDILAGKAVGARTIFVLSGNTKKEELDVLPDFIAADLLEAVEKIILV